MTIFLKEPVNKFEEKEEKENSGGRSERTASTVAPVTSSCSFDSTRCFVVFLRLSGDGNGECNNTQPSAAVRVVPGETDIEEGTCVVDDCEKRTRCDLRDLWS